MTTSIYGENDQMLGIVLIIETEYTMYLIFADYFDGLIKSMG